MSEFGPGLNLETGAIGSERRTKRGLQRARERAFVCWVGKVLLRLRQLSRVVGRRKEGGAEGGERVSADGRGRTV